ncbi:MAG TPA: replication-relaxation family protein [Candidatus Sulfotelmatobacter sp.]
MRTSDGEGMVIQERDRHLLRELALLRVIDREQAKMIAGFWSTTRANRRLLALVRTGLLKRFFLGTRGAGQKSIYGISRKGAALVAMPYRGLQRRNDESLVADLFVQHQLAVNDLYCSLTHTPIPIPGISCERWVHFFQPVVPEIRLIPDGYVELRAHNVTIACFLEIDRGVETLKTWTEKVRNYLQLALTGTFEREFHQQSFRVLVIANSARRMLSIRKAVLTMTTKIFWFATLADAQGEGFFNPIWLRPKGEDRLPLIDQPS